MKKSTISRKKIRLAIIGTGGMASRHADMFGAIRTCKIEAACDIDPEKAVAFATRYSIPQVFTDYKKLLASPDIDAVSIVVPDAFHAPIALACIKAGKHLLCEKPLALNYADAKRMLVAAKKAGVVNMVNFSYRDWSATQAIAKLIHAGKLGELRHIEASYLQSWLASKVWGDWRTSPSWLWRLSKKHGSNGVLGDVGIHILDFAMFPAGRINKVYCQLKTFAKAKDDQIGEYVLDANDSAVMNVSFENGAIGTIHTTRWSGGNGNRLSLQISGTLGTIDFDSDRSTTSYRICAGANLDKNEWLTVECPPTPTNYERFIRSIQKGENDMPSFQQGANVQKILDACLESASLDQPVCIKA